jgi:hypothetical protein
MVTEVFVNYENFIPITQIKKGNFQGIWSRSRNLDLRLRGAERNIFGSAILLLPWKTDGPESNMFIYVAFLSHTKSIPVRTQKKGIQNTTISVFRNINWVRWSHKTK